MTLEQYPTPPGVAAHLLHRASLHGDLDRTVVDLGCGTGILAIGAALAGSGRVIGVEIDRPSLGIARENATAVEPPVAVDWLHADATAAPLCPSRPGTVIMNPPFGAQHSSQGDRGFLETASRIADVSYSIHNAGSHDFVTAFVTDHDGSVTHAFAAEIDLDRRFPFHTEETRSIQVEVFRIEWAH